MIVFFSAVNVSHKEDYHLRRYVCIFLSLTMGFEWGVKCKTKTRHNPEGFFKITCGMMGPGETNNKSS